MTRRDITYQEKLNELKQLNPDILQFTNGQMDMIY